MDNFLISLFCNQLNIFYSLSPFCSITIAEQLSMAPKRGLAASQKAKKAKKEAPEPVEAISPSEPTQQLFPEDGLTISDLFELKQSVSALLTSAEDSKAEGERQEEARGLLRGILHGCEGLEAVVPVTEEASRLSSLGLDSPLAVAKLLYLQAFALHEMSSILPPPLSAVSTSSAGGATKKRKKVDLAEPTSAIEWIELALEKYQSAQLATKDSLKWQGFIEVEGARALLDRAVIEMLKKDFKRGNEFMKKLELKIESITTLLASYQPSTITYEEEDCDLATALLRLLSLFVSLLDHFAESETTSLEEHLHSLNIVTKAVSSPFINPADEATEFWDAENRTELRKLQVNLLKADVLMASFTMREVAVTKKYRGVDGEDEDEDGDVVPLPETADVLEARKVGKQGECLVCGGRLE